MNRAEQRRSRRGAALAAGVAVLALVGLVVVGAVAATGDDAQSGVRRLEAARAFGAAESGLMACLKQQSEDASAPLTGSYTLPGGESVTIVQPFAPAPALAGTAIVEGRFGGAVRRLSTRFE